MAERITDKQVADLIDILRADAPIDAKVQQTTAVKSSIKQHTVPESCIQPLFDALRTASSSHHAALVNAGFTALNHLFTRLARQDSRYLTKEAPRILPLIVEKLGDQKEKFRQVATQALITLHKFAPQDVERSVRNTAMAGKNPRAKEASLHWLLQMHQDHGLQFRAYVPNLMELLEDAEEVVRGAAKSTVIELFRNAPNGAKSDLKRQLKNFKVRPVIEQAIVKELNPTSSAPASQTDSFDEPAPTRPTLSASVSALSERPVTPGILDNRPDSLEPMYVNTLRELEEILRDMHYHFEGKETEQNWMKREESMTTLRRLIAGNAATDFSDQFLSGLRALLDGIIKAIVSLRTSLSKEGCSLVQDIARVYGPAMDPMVELLMQTFIKLTAATKKISSQLANATVDTIIARVTYTTRIMQHIWLACQDKNVQPRLYSCGWLKTLLNKEAHHKHHIEHTGGLELIEKCIKKGLGDANPGVREKMRATYWTYAGIWPARAETIMSGLDATAAKLLQNDPNNPNSPKRPEGGARPGLGLSKSTIGTSKPSLRDTMTARKRAMESKALPARPGSAMSHFSPVRTVSGSSQAPSATTRTRPESAIITGGLSGAPVRPGRKRPEVAARPATAGPYSVRSHDQPSVEETSPPSKPRTKAVTPKTIAASPKRTVPKTARPHQAPGGKEANVPTPTRSATPKSFGSPRSTPSRTVQPSLAPASSTSTKALEDFTLVVPTVTTTAASPAREEPLPQSPVEVQPTALSPSGTPSRHPKPQSSTPISLRERAASAPAPSPPGVREHITEPAPTAPTSSERSLEVYEDPFTEEQAPTQPTFTGPVLEDRPINEDAAILAQASQRHHHGDDADQPMVAAYSPEKTKQNSQLLNSGIAKIHAKTLDVHGFRKLQSIIRDAKTAPLLTDDKFDALVSGLFAFLEAPPAPSLTPERAQDVKAQILATIRLLLRRMRASFQPHVSRALESLLRARAGYDARTHIVSGMEVLATDLAALGDKSEIVLVLSRALGAAAAAVDGAGGGGAGGGDDDDAAAAAPGGGGAAKSLSMGLHVLSETLLDSSGNGGNGEAAAGVGTAGSFALSDAELGALAGLAARCLESLDSAVRMDAVALCVALHARVGDARFWEAVKGVKEDPKSLITYYIVRRQREMGAANGSAGASSVVG
ncbi:hypothetical protein VTK26DRAFT_6928 [Humicola hyalothermophila]